MRCRFAVFLLLALAACDPEPVTPTTPAQPPTPAAVNTTAVSPEVPPAIPSSDPKPPAPDDDSPAGMLARAEHDLRAFWDGLDPQELMNAAMLLKPGASARQTMTSAGPLRDPWGGELMVQFERSATDSAISACSPGPDGVFGTTDDMRWPRDP